MTASSSPAPQPSRQPAAPASLAKGASDKGASDKGASAGGRHAAEPTLGQLVSDASAHLSTIVHGEIELAKLELRASVKNAGTGAGMFIGAAVLLVFALIYGFFALAEGLVALGLSRWLGFLVVFGFLLLLTALLVVIGIKKVKRVKAPKRTIETTKETVDYLKKSRG